MKRIYSKLLLLVALTAGMLACNDKGNTPEQPQVDYDKMIGTWTLNSYSQKWINTTDDVVELDTVINHGSITIRKEDTGEDGLQYFYKENFLGNEEYEGRIAIENGRIVLCAEDGFTRKDLYNNYEYTVSFPAENKMEWTYEWTGAHTRNSVTHQDKRTVKGVFTKQQ